MARRQCSDGAEGGVTTAAQAITGPRFRAQSEVARMQRGTVEFFNPDLNYGFIKPDDGGRDIFVHVKAVDRAGLFALLKGQRVEFEVVTGRNGKTEADKLRLLAKEELSS
jgi:CspA family cold shock protein